MYRIVTGMSSVGTEDMSFLFLRMAFYFRLTLPLKIDKRLRSWILRQNGCFTDGAACMALAGNAAACFDRSRESLRPMIPEEATMTLTESRFRDWTDMEKLQHFLDEWTDDSLNVKPVFLSLYQGLTDRDDVALECHIRPGITCSLRAFHAKNGQRPLFVLMDVIDDDPHERWLSVCFYGDMIQDPDELGDLIPEGLLGSDGYCFDISEADTNLSQYVAQRIEEAYTHAARGA